MRNNYQLEEFKVDVVSAVKEVRKFVTSNKVLDKDDSEALFECIKYLMEVSGDVNHLLQRWPRVNIRIYSLLTRMEERLDDLDTACDKVWKEEYVRLVRDEASKDHVAKALADTCATYMKSAALARQYKHLVKLLERTYKLSENLLRVLEHLSNNMRQDNRDAKV